MEYKNKKLEEFNKNLFNKKVAIIGLGVSNIPLIDYMYDKKAKVTVFDDREEDKIPKEIINKIKEYKFETSFGKNNLSKLKGFDIIFRSPSCMPTKPELEKEAKNGAIVTTEIEMLMEMCPAKIIGVTGSDGKTTTTSLIYEILKKAGYNTYLGGNIGTPLFTKLEEMKPEDIVVLELSSFQLMGMKISPHIGVITNITPNHLNIHKDYEEYIDAKKNIFKYQNENDIVILNYDNEITRNAAKEAMSKVVFFSHKEKLENGFIVDEKIIKECERANLVSFTNKILKGDKMKLNSICKKMIVGLATVAIVSGYVPTISNIVMAETIQGDTTKEIEIPDRNLKAVLQSKYDIDKDTITHEEKVYYKNYLIDILKKHNIFIEDMKSVNIGYVELYLKKYNAKAYNLGLYQE